MWSALLATALNPAWAGVVAAVPPGVHEVAVVLCTDETRCGDDARAVAELDPDVPTLILEAVIESIAPEGVSSNQADPGFAAAVEQARTAALAARWREVETAADDGRRILSNWDGTPSPRDLFDLWYLQGAARLELSHGTGGLGHEGSFQQAAAAAWNRRIVLPPIHPDATPRVEAAWYAQLDLLVDKELGELLLASGPPGTTYWLDGVELGPGPLVVSAFPGRHRLTAVGAALGAVWKQDVELLAGRTLHREAVFENLPDVRDHTALWSAVIDGGEVSTEAADLLARWAVSQDVHTVRLARADPETGLVTLVRWDPRGQRRVPLAPAATE